jgi:hypothetical protein
MRTNVLIFLTAAVPALLTASTFPIGISSTPVDFIPSSSTTGTVALGTCATSCILDGEYKTNTPPLKWTLMSDGTLAYSSSGAPDVYDLAGSATAFSLTDAPLGDSIPGTITWNTATVGVPGPGGIGSFTDVHGTLTLGTVSFASNTDALALELTAALGSLPVSGETGSLDFLVNCSPFANCISLPTASLFPTESRVHRHHLKDPPGVIAFADVTLNSSVVPEPGTIFVVPALLLGGLILRKHLRS